MTLVPTPLIGRAASYGEPVSESGAEGPAQEAMLIAAPDGTDPEAGRRTRVLPGSAERLLHADLHNHTQLSDGRGWAEDAFASMRAAGLDVAAVTDHAFGICAPTKTIDDEAWRHLGKLADAADDPGSFVALRGFEWSSPTLGHMNVWGSRSWTEPLPLAADGVAPGLAIAHAGPAADPIAMAAFRDWLTTGDGTDGLVGFNHPGREQGRFGLFRYDARLGDRVVAFEMFNRGDDYLFEGTDAGDVSPLVACLDAGWRVGLVGVTDEHSPNWGFPVGLGRTGLWTRGRTRSAVHDAMSARRMFATRERGLRVDAAADGVAMGGLLPRSRGVVTFVVDIDGPELRGLPLRLQVLRPGRPLPTVVHEADFVADGSVVTCTTRLDRTDGPWVVLRVTDPGRLADRRAEAFDGYRSAGRTIAYLSPFFLG